MNGAPQRAVKRSLVWVFVALSVFVLGPRLGAQQPTPLPEVIETRIELNQADAKQLTSLPGIGPSKAKAIVAYRSKRAFKKSAELLRVPGIGRKTYKRIRPFIYVKKPR